MLSLLNHLIILLNFGTLVTGQLLFPKWKMTSTHSDTCLRYNSTLAHDMNFHTFSCSISNPVTGLNGAWWEGNLGSRQNVRSVKIMKPLIHHYRDLLQNFTIYICNLSVKLTTSFFNCIPCDDKPLQFPPGIRDKEFNCTTNSGQYVVVFKPLALEFFQPARQIAIAEINFYID